MTPLDRARADIKRSKDANRAAGRQPLSIQFAPHIQIINQHYAKYGMDDRIVHPKTAAEMMRTHQKAEPNDFN